MKDEILTKKETAEFLKISMSHLSNLMKRKEVPYSKMNKKVLFLKEDLIKWVKSKRVK